MMSCHNPFIAHEDGYDGYAVWADIPQIVDQESNKRVRFVLLIGDQLYADDWKNALLKAEDDQACLRLYLEAYKKFWSNIHYRRVFCSLPAMLMWDDHDITDGWGSTADSFAPNSSEFKPEWLRMFKCASAAFARMQASRNPAPLTNAPSEGFDCGFRIGKWGFMLLDLRTNRNLKRQMIMSAGQAHRVKQWIDANKREMRALFIISPVVFSHGSPVIDDFGIYIWPWVMRGVDWLAQQSKWGQGMRTEFKKNLDDIRDDIQDSWGVERNADQADDMLDYLFGLQNDPEHPVSVVILSGDIHTSGYATIYSGDQKHDARSTMPHITSSSVSYAPFNWLMEAVYRHASKTVALGRKGTYISQVSHHFCARNVAVLSIRPKRDVGDDQLKVKFYLEGYPEPQILLFDLDRISHRENIAWVAQERLFSKAYAPTSRVDDVERILENKAQAVGEQLNFRDSIVDLMKALGTDSSLGNRKRLAQKWGFQGALGAPEMNIFLHQQLMRRFIAAGGDVPEELRQELQTPA
jgi:Domain of unknown function (DUF3597)/PhoD-like phosphatase